MSVLSVTCNILGLRMNAFINVISHSVDARKAATITWPVNEVTNLRAPLRHVQCWMLQVSAVPVQSSVSLITMHPARHRREELRLNGTLDLRLYDTFAGHKIPYTTMVLPWYDYHSFRRIIAVIASFSLKTVDDIMVVPWRTCYGWHKLTV